MEPKRRPGCYTRGRPTIRAPRFTDRGRTCMQATTRTGWDALLRVEPGCAGCMRARLSMRRYWKRNP